MTCRSSGACSLLREAWRVTTAELIDAIVWRARADLQGLRERAAAGVEPWATMWDAGHGAANTAITRFIGDSAQSWLAALR